MNPINHALQIYNQHNQNFAELLNWHFANGVVISLPDCFLLGFFCDKSNLSECRVLAESDCIFVTMCVGNMREACMQIVELVPWVAYQREFKGDDRIKITNFKKLFNKL
jgi:hypothetical protein